MSFKELKVTEINENFMKNIGDEWMLITAGDENIETKTLNKLCLVLDCKLEDIAEFIKEES